MVNFLLVAFLFKSSVHQTMQTLDWQAAIVQSPKAEAYSRHKIFQSPSNIANESQTPSANLNPPKAAALNRFQNHPDPVALHRQFLELDYDRRSITSHAWQLVNQGKVVDAIHYLRVAYLSFPDGEIGTLIVDLDLRIQSNSNAYKDYMEHEQTTKLNGAARLSLVASLNGQVFPGQRAFLIREVERGWEKWFDDPQDCLPQGNSARDIAELSYLALGRDLLTTDYEDAASDISAAIELDPKNSLGYMLLELVDANLGRFQGALEASEHALKYAHSPEAKKMMAWEIGFDKKRVQSLGAVGKPAFDPSIPPRNPDAP
ncbi:MAG TPA: hypothetical protein VGL56_01660 [Fimbriimonadaceae bacterium]